MQLGTATLGTALLGGVLPMPTYADSTGAGEDGAPAGDPRFKQKFDASSSGASGGMTTLAAAETSYNGWPVGTPGSSIGIVSYYAPNTSILIPVKSGDVATVLMYVAGRFNSEVEALRAGQVWGYDYRKNVNNPSVWSNHASGTAIDLNSALHPNGAKNTFSGAKVAVIRNILAFCGDVIYWGGDYSGTTDEMHFEIDVAPGDPRLPALVARIRGDAGPSTVVSLRARADSMYVVAENGGSAPLIANRAAIGQWEQFDLIDLGGRSVALCAHANSSYVCADNGGATPLIANRHAVGPWETFTLVRNGDGTVSFRAQANGKYVTAENGGASSLIANRAAIGLWESFDLVGDARPSTVVSLRARADSMYVVAENGGSAPLIANRTAIEQWEQFDLIDLGGGSVALRAHANNSYICADNAGATPLIANRHAVGPWETFTLVRNGDGTVSFRAQANGKYVTAENGGASSLIANRRGIGLWESFDLVNA
jgi:hypothetical protein